MLGGLGQALGDDLAVEVDVARRAEDHGDDRQPLDGGRAQRLHARHAVDGVLDRLRDEHLHLLGRKPRRLRLDADLRRSELGEDVVLGARDRERPVAEQQDGESDDDAAEAHGEADDGGLEAARAGRCGALVLHQSPPTWICARNSSDRSSCAPLVTIAGCGSEKVLTGTTNPPSLVGRRVGRDLAAREAVVVGLDVDPGMSRPPDHGGRRDDEAVDRLAGAQKRARVHAGQHAAVGGGGIEEAQALDLRVGTGRRRDVADLSAPRAAADLDRGGRRSVDRTHREAG